MNTAVLDSYLAAARPTHRAALRQLHDAVMTAVPEAETGLRRGVPAYRYLHRPLVSIGDAQKHVALYVMQGTVLAATRRNSSPSIPRGLSFGSIRAR